jgi:soluble lytic murein transglycosylase-like protein
MPTISDIYIIALMTALTPRALSLLVALLLQAHTGYALADYYVYKGKDGTIWYTDRRLPVNRFTLIATIGRPKASISCTEITPKALEQRSQRFLPVIKEYAETYKVDYLLIKAIITVESCFDNYAVSRVGAKGLMQLMPDTAKRMGVYNIFNAKDNIRGGVRYFSQMLERFDHNSKLALAAYNAGPQAVEKHQGVPPYEETQNYIKRVMDYYQRYSRKVDS